MLCGAKNIFLAVVLVTQVAAKLVSTVWICLGLYL